MSSSGFAALCSAFGRYDVVHIHAEGPAFFAWLPKLLGKRVVVTIHGIDWQREKWQSGLGSKFIHQGEKNAAKYADEVIVLSKGVQDYFKETYGRKTHFIPNGVNRPQIREASLITDSVGFTPRLNIVYDAIYFIAGGLIFLYRKELAEFTSKHKVIAGAILLIATVAYFAVGGSTLTMLFFCVAALAYTLGCNRGGYWSIPLPSSSVVSASRFTCATW